MFPSTVMKYSSAQRVSLQIMSLGNGHGQYKGTVSINLQNMKSNE
jgi:hypothetical protein